MKKTLELIAGIMLLMSVAMMGFAQTPDLKVLQTWHYAFDPSGTTLPNGFKEKTSVWVNTITKKSYNYTVASGWKEVNSGLYVAGANGQAATVTVGTTTTLPAGSQATVTNSGTASNAVLNFAIPQGAQGASGSGSANLGTTKYVFNETDLVNAWNGIATGATTHIVCGATIYSTKQFTCPTNFTNQPGRRITIDLNGHMIKDQTPTASAYLFGLRFNDQTAANAYANDPLTYHFKNGKLSGKGTATAALIDLGGSHWSTFENLWLNNANYGIVLRWCMFSRIINNYSDDIYMSSWFVSRGDWSGSTNNNSCSNHTLIEGCRAFNREGAFAPYQGYAVSGLVVRHCTSEGGNPQYLFYFNSQAAAEVKSVTIEHIHCESYPTVAVIYSRGSGGFQTIIRDLNLQVFGTNTLNVIHAENAGGGHLVIASNITWMTTPCKFKDTGGCVYEFDNCYDGGNLFTAGRWNGTIGKGQSSYWAGTNKVIVKNP